MSTWSKMTGESHKMLRSKYRYSFGLSILSLSKRLNLNHILVCSRSNYHSGVSWQTQVFTSLSLLPSSMYFALHLVNVPRSTVPNASTPPFLVVDTKPTKALQQAHNSKKTQNKKPLKLSYRFVFKELVLANFGGCYRGRTCDLRLVRAPLYQLS